MYRWIQEGAPQLPDGTFDIDAVAAWAEERTSRNHRRSADVRHTGVDEGGGEADGGTSSAAQQMAQARRDALQVDIERKRFDLEQKRGEHVRRDLVAEMLSQRMATLKRRLGTAARTIASRVGRDFDVDQIAVEEVADEVLQDVLREIYGRKPADLVA